MSDEDRILETLGSAEREAARVPDRWRALALGTATEAELAELKAEALRDPEARRRYERFRPFDEASDRALTAHALKTLKKPRRRALPWMALAAAASIALAWLIIPRSGGFPAYVIETSGEDAPQRGDAPADTVPTHHANSALTIVLRPASQIDDAAVDAFVVENGAARSVELPAEVAPTGAIRIDGRLNVLLPGAQGEVTLLLRVREKGEAPLDAAAVQAAWTAHDARVLSYRFRIVE